MVDDAGFTFRGGDVHDLERMLRMLLSDPQVRDAAGRRGQERVWRGYLWPQITSEIERTYLRVTGRGGIPETVAAPEIPTQTNVDQRNRAA